jgi:hypothetical protein
VNHRRKPSLAHNLLLIGAISAVVALLIWGGLAVQLATGGDPALGDATTASTAPATSATTSPSTPVFSGEDDSDDDDAVVVTPAPAPVESTPTPVQTSVS